MRLLIERYMMGDGGFGRLRFFIYLKGVIRHHIGQLSGTAEQLDELLESFMCGLSDGIDFEFREVIHNDRK